MLAPYLDDRPLAVLPTRGWEWKCWYMNYGSGLVELWLVASYHRRIKQWWASTGWEWNNPPGWAGLLCLSVGGVMEALVRLCFIKLQVWALSLLNYRKVLEMLHLECAQDLGEHSTYNPTSLLNPSPTSAACDTCGPSLQHKGGIFISPEKKQQVIIQFTLKLLNVIWFQKLHLDTVYFLKGHMGPVVQKDGHFSLQRKPCSFRRWQAPIVCGHWWISSSGHMRI